MPPWWAVAILTLWLPLPASAQPASAGLASVYDGALQPLVSSSVLALVVVAMLAGTVGRRVAPWLVLALPAAWLAGGSIGLGVDTAIEAPWFSAGLLVLAAGLVAADLRPPPPALLVLVLLIGGLHGLLDGAALAVAGAGPVALLGAVAAMQVVVLLVTVVVASLNGASGRVAVRMAGSWIAAVGMLMTGWLLHGSG